MFLPQLFSELKARASWTQQRLDAGHLHRVPQQEETITESVLLDLALALPALNVQMFTKHEESRYTGADWVWWWQGRDAWFGGLVQAKLLKDAGGGSPYYELGYVPKPSVATPQPVPQVERLLAASRATSLPALYALYNASTNPRLVGPCLTIAQGSQEEGISVLDGHVAHALWQGLPARPRSSKPPVEVPLSIVSAHARPWSCLIACTMFSCPQWRPQPAQDLWQKLNFPKVPPVGDLAYALASMHDLLAGSLSATQYALATDEVRDAGLLTGVFRSPPDYVTQPELFTSGEVDEDPGVDEVEPDYQRLPPGVDNLIVVSDGNVRRAG